MISGPMPFMSPQLKPITGLFSGMMLLNLFLLVDDIAR
jgi:hypothetical protein